MTRTTPTHKKRRNNSASTEITAGTSRAAPRPRYIRKPCSSGAVCTTYITRILSVYECYISVFSGFTPPDLLNFMFTCKAFAQLISEDRKLIDVLVNKYLIIKPTPKLAVRCEWCSQYGCECAGCYHWDHNGYAQLSAHPRMSDPSKRLWRFCGACTEKLPKAAWQGRCTCSTKNVRNMCRSCKDDERDKLMKKGFKAWFRPRKERMAEEDLLAIAADSETFIQSGGGPQHSPTPREMEKASDTIYCEGTDGDGYLCMNEVGPLGGYPATSEGAEQLNAHGAQAGRLVNVCTWCGLVAVDVPSGNPTKPWPGMFMHGRQGQYSPGD